MNLSPGSRIVYSLSAMEAQGLGSSVIETEHLWLALLKAEDVLPLDGNDFLNLSAEEVRSGKAEVRNLLKRFKQVQLDCVQGRRRLRRLVKDSQQNRGEFSGHRSPLCREAFLVAERIARHEGAETISAVHLAQAVLEQTSSPMEKLLAEVDVPKDRLLEALGSTDSVAAVEQQSAGNGFNKEELSAEQKPTKTPLLDGLGRELVGLAREGRIDPVIGRSEEIKKVARILVQKRKNNPVLVGEAGVGKTCIVEGLALRCAQQNAPPFLKNLRIYEITMGALIAGTKYRGEFEERLERLIKEASSDPSIIVFIDEMHTMVGAGAGSEGAMNAANILKPALARGLIKCIGATTTAEYRKHIEKDQALERRLQVVWVDEPTRNEAIAILSGLKPRFEAHHNVSITRQAVEAAVDLSLRYLIDFRLPDKAVDLIDRACAQTVLKSLSFIGTDQTPSRAEIGIDEVARAVSERTRVPIENLTIDEGKRFLCMEDLLRERVMGQDAAIREVSEAVRTAKAGLNDPRRPVGVFLFLGSTGTGKTELAKALAEFLFLDEHRLIRVDMSEYQEKHSIARLLGAPPGYVGHDEEGQLSSAVRSNPYSVILLDEIEKAHPDIFDIFLQIFDEGMLTDARGRKVNFRESIIILTSNLGSKRAIKKDARPIGVDLNLSERRGQEEGFRAALGAVSEDDMRTVGMMDTGNKKPDQWQEYRRHILDAVTSTLRPELLNRIRNKVVFQPLDRNTVRRIVEKIMEGINLRLAPKNITVRLGDGVADFLMQEGYSEKDGAREMERVIEHHIVQPLSAEILAGRVRPGTAVEAYMTKLGSELQFRRYSG